MLKTIPFKQVSSNASIKTSRNNLFIFKTPEDPKVIREGVVVFDGDFDVLINENVELFNDPVLIYSNGSIEGFVASEGREPNKDTPFLKNIYEKPEELRNGYGICDDPQQVINKFNLEESEHTFCLILRPLKILVEKAKPIPVVLMGDYIGETVFPQSDMVYEFRIIPWIEPAESRVRMR